MIEIRPKSVQDQCNHLVLSREHIHKCSVAIEKTQSKPCLKLKMFSLFCMNIETAFKDWKKFVKSHLFLVKWSKTNAIISCWAVAIEKKTQGTTCFKLKILFSGKKISRRGRPTLEITQSISLSVSVSFEVLEQRPRYVFEKQLFGQRRSGSLSSLVHIETCKDL